MSRTIREEGCAPLWLTEDGGIELPCNGGALERLESWVLGIAMARVQEVIQLRLEGLLRQRHGARGSATGRRNEGMSSGRVEVGRGVCNDCETRRSRPG